MKETKDQPNPNYTNHVERLSLSPQSKTDDMYALVLLQPLLTNYSFLAFTGASLRPFCLAHMVNDIIVNSRKRIIEFGAGISTIVIGRLIKKNRLKTTLLSIENNEEWAKALMETLKSEGIDDVVTVLYASLKPCKLSVENNEWYDIKTLKKHIGNKKFDMVIIDGPMAWEAGKGMARYPAVPFMASNLANNFSIYLDDAIRAGEQKVIQAWEEEYGINFKVTSNSLAYCYRGNSFHTEIFKL